MVEEGIPGLSRLTKCVLHELLRQALIDTRMAHDLIWYYATQYEDTNAVEEIEQLMSWLQQEKKEKEQNIVPILCETSGKILAKHDGYTIYLWCRRHSCWEEKLLKNLYNCS